MIRSLRSRCRINVLQCTTRQHRQRRTLQCSTISLFLCVIATVVTVSLVSSTRHLWKGSNWFIQTEQVVAKNNNNNSTTANSLLIKDRLYDDNETTSLSTDMSLRANNFPITKNASVIIVGGDHNNNTARERYSSTSISSIYSNQQQTTKQQEKYPIITEVQRSEQKAASVTTTTTTITPHDVSLQFQELGCLTRTPILVKARNLIHNQSISILNMTFQSGCGPLRRDWRDNPPISRLAKVFLHHQSNCSLPTVTWHDVDYDNGLGGHFFYWSLFLCHAWEHGMRLRTNAPDWIWLDQTLCDLQQAQRSPWLCYWPQSEHLCAQQEVINASLVVTTEELRCEHNRKGWFVKTLRRAAVEFMFRSVSPLVIQEARRQVGVLFGPNGAPPDLITVHLRWGDKGNEMKLFPIKDYITAVAQLLHEELNRTDDNSTANIYLATEDPVAADAFLQSAPKTWNIFVDVSVKELSLFRPPPSYLNCASIMAQNTRGRGGLVNVGAILVAMEANYYVLTTGSGYSRMINRLRTQILDPRCGKCTRAIDLSKGNDPHRFY